jgi:hypothetical protein
LHAVTVQGSLPSQDGCRWLAKLKLQSKHLAGFLLSGHQIGIDLVQGTTGEGIES